MPAAISTNPNWDYACGLGRAVAGAIIFSLPLLMTMEMWSLGLYVHPPRLLLFMVANFAVLVVLSRFGGFEHTFTIAEDILDALAAYAVGIIASTAVLSLFGVFDGSMPFYESSGMVAIQSIPASFGAMIARKQLSAENAEDDEDHAARSAGHGGQLFLMMAGALFFAFNIAPTEEIILIGFKMTPWHQFGLIAASLFGLHSLVFATGFAGQKDTPDGYGQTRLFFMFTVPGYAIALLVSAYVLWTFGRLEQGDIAMIITSVIVLAFPAAIGAAIARLVV